MLTQPQKLTFHQREAQIYFNLMRSHKPSDKANYLRSYINLYLTQPGKDLYSKTYISRDFIEYLLANFAQQSKLALPIIQMYQKQFDTDFEPSLISYVSHLPPTGVMLELTRELTYVITKRRDRQEVLAKAMDLSTFLMSPSGLSYLLSVDPQLLLKINELYQNLINKNHFAELVPYYEPIFHPSLFSNKMQKLTSKLIA
jgi:hypothetical protein